jgi:tryptophan-rich sensory protein
MPKIEVMKTTTPTWFSRPAARGWVAPASGASGARSFHAGLAGYAPTPLVDLPVIAAELSVGQVLVKDESARLGLPAFKVLGASWACAQVVADVTGLDLGAAGVTGAGLDLASLRQAAQGSKLRLVTATDGNHGRAVARMAGLLGVTATVFVPAVMTVAARQAIVAEGAHVEDVDGNYDDAVRAALAYTRDGAGRELVQDTAWPGYERVPAWIVEGYQTLPSEIDDALGISPDLVAVPVGVGSLAQAVVSHYRRADGPRPADRQQLGRGAAQHRGQLNATRTCASALVTVVQEFCAEQRQQPGIAGGACERERSGKVRVMTELSARAAGRTAGLRQVAAWTSAAVVYGAAQGLSAWVAQHARGRGTRPQYEQFERPAFAPPGAVFPVVWSALNATTATSAWRVWHAGEAGPGAPSRRTVLTWWAAAVIVRSGYVPLAFGSRRLWAATADSALLCAVMAYYASQARRVDQTAAALAVPEVAWTAFATVLSAVVAAKNKDL